MGLCQSYDDSKLMFSEENIDKLLNTQMCFYYAKPVNKNIFGTLFIYINDCEYCNLNVNDIVYKKASPVVKNKVPINFDVLEQEVFNIESIIIYKLNGTTHTQFVSSSYDTYEITGDLYLS